MDASEWRNFAIAVTGAFALIRTLALRQAFSLWCHDPDVVPGDVAAQSASECVWCPTPLLQMHINGSVRTISFSSQSRRKSLIKISTKEQFR
jgi:hypothetical protein